MVSDEIRSHLKEEQIMLLSSTALSKQFKLNMVYRKSCTGLNTWAHWLNYIYKTHMSHRGNKSHVMHENVILSIGVMTLCWSTHIYMHSQCSNRQGSRVVYTLSAACEWGTAVLLLDISSMCLCAKPTRTESTLCSLIFFSGLMKKYPIQNIH